MDYLELDDTAMQALGELGGDSDSHYVPPTPSPSIYITSRARSRRRVETTYLIRLGSPFPTPRDLANALDLSRVPQLEHGTAKDGEASFCRIPQSAINALNAWAAKHPKAQKLTKIRIGLAHKDLGELPLLGRDPTLPQHRPDFPSSTTNQHVLEYPVRYFFYGTLADPERLGRLFGMCASELQTLQAASLLGGRIKRWAGKYKALVDDSKAIVNGFAYVVISADQEDALRVYEGDGYEVVAARLVVDGQEIMGRTFRFAGFDDELVE